ncbi:aminopeptidase-P [Crepidotus variabilis]|uniref:Aminopeptidase-P n=1 Tax=Crepidotus variabilis TaxID=179855 RepID=A0A9P6ED30_9AGAR|nr:aminopeptidase-P [Crepidotus variabilis]
MAPPPPPPPPPICFPFTNKKPRRRLSWSSSDRSRSPMPPGPSEKNIVRHPSFSPTSTVTTQAESITFHSDSEIYDEVPDTLPILKDSKGRPKLARSNTMTGSKKWGYGWGAGRKDKEKEAEAEAEMAEKSSSQSQLPLYQPVVRRDSKSTQASRRTQDSARTHDTHRTYDSQRSKASAQSQETYRSGGSRSTAPKPRPPLLGALQQHDSTSTLVGSAYERKINDQESIRTKPDTTDRLEEMRRLMAKDNLDYYVIPSEDAHGSEYVAASDKRREFISGFTGSAGQAIVSKSSAYLFTDSRYWLQAAEELDENWTLIRTGAPGIAQDWIDWIVERARDTRIGVDARMISHEKALLINSKLGGKSSKLIYPPQNLVDLIWKDKPTKSLQKVYIQGIEFTGKDATYKIAKLREWIKMQPPDRSYPNKTPTAADIPVAMLVTSLACIAYTLNLRGSDIPYNPLFHAYLFVSLDRAIVFLEPQKLPEEVIVYLNSIGVEHQGYTDLWPFLRKRGWGEGRVLIAPQTSYAISLMLTSFRYTVTPSYVEHMMSLKNETEIECMKRAYLRDGVSFVRFLAWLEGKLAEGYDITEYEAAWRLTEYRRKNKHFMGLAYENISASGANAALPHYSPKKSSAALISRDHPYLNDSGAQYYDGTCDTTRTMHFGRPTTEMCEAYTRVLQGHIAIDSAIFPEGTSGRQLDVLARKALWKDGLNYMHGTGHGFGAFLSVHEGPQSFASNVPLVPGHVITNEPGFYLEGKWGMRIESALVVRKVKTRGEFNGDVWLGFERFTCVPIQTRMVKDSMLTKEEKAWIKEHNQKCYDKVAPFLKEDKRALKWLKREADRGIGLAAPAAGIHIDWD